MLFIMANGRRPFHSAYTIPYYTGNAQGTRGGVFDFGIFDNVLLCERMCVCIRVRACATAEYANYGNLFRLFVNRRFYELILRLCARVFVCIYFKHNPSAIKSHHL